MKAVPRVEERLLNVKQVLALGALCAQSVLCEIQLSERDREFAFLKMSRLMEDAVDDIGGIEATLPGDALELEAPTTRDLHLDEAEQAFVATVGAHMPARQLREVLEERRKAL